jgi:hypothetical protein
VVVADGVHDLQLWRLLLHADMLITSVPTLFTVRHGGHTQRVTVASCLVGMTTGHQSWGLAASSP